jgi:transcriptional regulator with XRE-family HTH domain
MDGRNVDREVGRKLGRNLWMARRRAGYSQDGLGALCGLHRTEIGFVENGERLPRVDTLLKLSGALERGEAAGRDRVARTRPSSRRQLRGQEAGMTTRAREAIAKHITSRRADQAFKELLKKLALGEKRLLFTGDAGVSSS